MRAYRPTGRKWEGPYKRNRSLLQGNIYAEGLAGHGYDCLLHFNRDKYLTVYVAGEGEYFFFDKEDIEKNNRELQEDIDSGKSTPKQLRELSAKYFDAVKKTSGAFQNSDLPKLSGAELLRLFRDFRKAMTVGPIITIQFLGYDICWAPNYRLLKFLESRLGKLGEKDKAFEYTEMLSATREMLAPIQEKADFLRVCIEIQKEKKLLEAFLKQSNVEGELENRPAVKRAFEKYVSDYAYVAAEYRGEPWPRQNWFEAFGKELRKDCAAELAKLEANHERALEKKRLALEKLKPPKDVVRVLEALEELLWQRDWSKGEYSKAYLNWRPFLREMARRMDCSTDDVGLHSADEVEAFLESGSRLPVAELERRRKRCAGIYLGKTFDVYSQGIDEITEKEGVAKYFESADKVREVEGIIASKGVARGKARVVFKPEEKDLVQDGEILVTYMTTVEFTPVFKKIAGLVTDEGGMASHAAIVSREFGLPCIIGTKNATRVFKTGEMIEVDANKGIARKL